MASRGAKAGVSSLAQRAQALVRALTGVRDARVDAAPNGRIIAVHVIPETGYPPQRVTQNVRSGLMAATGIAIEAARVYVVEKLPEPAPITKSAPAPAADVVEHAARPERPLAYENRPDTSSPGLRNGTVPTDTSFAGNADVPAALPSSAPIDRMVEAPPSDDRPADTRPADTRAGDSRAADDRAASLIPAVSLQHPFTHFANPPRVELLEVQRDETGAPRCRIIIETDGRRRLGTATNTRGSETTADLIAGAILSALEPSIPCDLHFDGMADVIIAGQRHVVVSLRDTNDWSHALSGAAPVYDSVENAIASAILNAIGIGIASKFSTLNRLVGYK